MKLSQYSKEELQNIIKNSSSYKDALRKLGISASGDSYNSLRKRIEEEEIDVSNLKVKKPGIKRTEENVFVLNSTADQSTLRKFYLKGQYSEYKCSICNLEPIWQGKELTLILDHINGINNDDRLENLRWVCPNCNQQLPTTGSKNLKKEDKRTYCIDCGKEIDKNSIRCLSCAGKARAEEAPMSREVLKELIRKQSFTSIGKQFNCSDNAIRKYCDKLDLPRTKKEINSYSDEEWNSI